MIEAMAVGILSGLAAYRLWKLAARDEITRWFWETLRKSHHPVVQWFDSLVTCAWCLGWWINAAIAATIWAITDMHPAAAILAGLAGSTITGTIALWNGDTDQHTRPEDAADDSDQGDDEFGMDDSRRDENPDQTSTPQDTHG